MPYVTRVCGVRTERMAHHSTNWDRPIVTVLLWFLLPCLNRRDLNSSKFIGSPGTEVKTLGRWVKQTLDGRSTENRNCGTLVRIYTCHLSRSRLT